MRRVADVGGEEAVERRRPSARARARRTSSRTPRGTRRRSRAASQTRCGSASRRRKKTVSRERRTSSSSSSRTGCGGSAHAGPIALRIGVRVAVGQRAEIGVGLGGVADRVGGEVAQPVRHPPERERREPAEERAHGGDAADAGQRERPVAPSLCVLVAPPPPPRASPSRAPPRAGARARRGASRNAVFQRAAAAGSGSSTSTG